MISVKKVSSIFMVIVMLMGIAVFSPLSADAKAKPKLNKTKVTMKIGKTVKLKLKKAPSYKVKWSTSKKKVATVLSGAVYGKSAGKATITAKYNGKKYKCKVTVKPNVKKFAENFTVYKNDTYKLVLKNSYGLTYNAKKWTSSKPSVASINKNGLIKGKKVGKVTITATDSSGNLIKGTVYVKNGYTALRDYIVKYGANDSDGYKYLQKNDGDFAYAIKYNSDTKQLIFAGRYSADSNVVTSAMAVPVSGAGSVGVNASLQYANNGISASTQAVIKPSSYDVTKDIDFEVISSNTDNTDKVKSLSNSIFKVSFYGWQDMIYDNLTMGFSALGFSNYKLV